MKVIGMDNLFCAGEKSGLFVGHTEAICTGVLAGYNSVRYALDMPLLVLPKETVVGDIIAYANYKLTTAEGRKNRYTFAGAEYFKRMKSLGMYTTDKMVIWQRVAECGLTDIFSEKLVR